MQYLEQCLEQQEQTYNSKQLAKVLEQERQVNLSADGLDVSCKKGVAMATNATQPAQKTRPSQKTTVAGRPRHIGISCTGGRY